MTKNSNARPPAATEANRVVVNIVGAGLAGLSAAIHLAGAGVSCRLISSQPSERAQSVLAEGGINGALDTMGEGDRPEYHYQDTMKAGCDIANPAAVRNLTQNAPDVLRWLDSLGVPFQHKGAVIQQRNFGGQKKKRTAYAESSTGKVLMTALIDEARKHEAEGLISRYVGFDFVELALSQPSDATNQIGSTFADVASGPGTQGLCTGLVVRNNVTGQVRLLRGPVLMACGGLNGMFPGKTTGTTANTGDAAAKLFCQGVAFSNLEMIQYHPTTLAIPRKRLLVSEAARGEGGRLFVMRNGKPWYFMEEKYPELGNLMPRDVVSREEFFVTHDSSCEDQVFLDCTGLSREVWRKRLPDLRREIIYYTGHDPAKEPIAVEPGIHYFMGGIHTDAQHRTNVCGLYAAGECCSLYHGANRLGGNSTLGAIYGGQRAAQTIVDDLPDASRAINELKDLPVQSEPFDAPSILVDADSTSERDDALGQVLFDSLGVVRTGATMNRGLERLNAMRSEARDSRERERIDLGVAMLESALFRKESRGAQYRSDYPQRSDDYRGTVVVQRTTAVGCGPYKIWLEPTHSIPS